MIFVALGTQDRSFKRLLEAVEKQIKLGNIKERVVVQAGETKYESDCMEIHDLIPRDEILKLYEECDLLICHGGVGSILDGLKCHKKIIAAARLKEYGEHQNDHQKQIIHEFTKQHYILELDDFDKLDEKIKEAKNFEPAEYQSNTLNFISQLETYIDEELKNQKGNKFRKFMQYGFYGFWAILIQIPFLFLFLHFGFTPLASLCFFDLFLICYRFFLHVLFFQGVQRDAKGEAIVLGFLTIQLLGVYFFPEMFQVNFVWKMLGVSILSGIGIYFLSILCNVRDVE